MLQFSRNRLSSRILPILCALIAGCMISCGGDADELDKPNVDNRPIPTEDEDDGREREPMSDIEEAITVGGGIGIAVGENQVAVVAPGYPMENPTTLTITGEDGTAVTYQNCDDERNPFELDEGVWNLQIEIANGDCADPQSTNAVTDYALESLAQHVMLATCSNTEVPGGTTYITIAMEEIETGDTTRHR